MKNLCPPLTKNTRIKSNTIEHVCVVCTLSLKKILKEFPRCGQECLQKIPVLVEKPV